MTAVIKLILLLGRVALVRGVAAYSHQTFPRTICRSVGTSVCPCIVEQTADRIRMPFSIIARTAPGMRQAVGYGDRSTVRGTFGARHCKQWGLYGVRVL